MEDNECTRPFVPLVAAALTLAACGGSSTVRDTAATSSQPAASPATPAPKPKKESSHSYPRGTHRASRTAVRVITGWANQLRAGHVRVAAGYFSIPVLVENASPLVHLDTRREVLAFNASLPCGAHVVRMIAGRHYTIATFVLTERPGSPGCGAAGQLAATAFVLRHGKIAEWRRVLVPPRPTRQKNLEQDQPAV